jgi:hypothetical protein
VLRTHGDTFNDMWLKSKTYTELLKTATTTKKKNPDLKLGASPTQKFIKKKFLQMAKKYMKEC